MEIDLTVKNYRCFPDEKPVRISISPGFTAFVGPNNSGKSSLLKFLYEFRRLFSYLSPAGPLLGAIRGGVAAFELPPSITDVAEVFSNKTKRDIVIDIRLTDLAAKGTPPATRLLITVPRSTNTWRADVFIGQDRIPADQDSQLQKGHLLLHRGTVYADLAPLFSACDLLARTIYIGAFRNAINVGGNEAYFDIQVGQSFVRAWRAWKTGPTKNQNEKTYRLTADIQRIFGFRALEINPSPDDTTLQLFIDGKSYKLNEVGSGLSQFIVVLANVAITEPVFLLIDEPELNLHPSLQLEFLTTLGSYAKNGVLFATHSMGLARAGGDRIYCVRRVDEGESHVALLEAFPRLGELLGELNFSGYRELGFTKVLLVEGASDVKTLRQFLRKMSKERTVVVLPLGGSQLINAKRDAELDEVKRISPEVYALIDSERGTAGAALSAERQGFVETCQRLGITCGVLERRAIENYLSDRAVKKLMGEKYRALGPFERREQVSPVWAKSENWRIALEMAREELDGTDLGKFVASL